MGRGRGKEWTPRRNESVGTCGSQGGRAARGVSERRKEGRINEARQGEGGQGKRKERLPARAHRAEGNVLKGHMSRFAQTDGGQRT
eukprot:6162065-Pleurochrysis_carterae.AAC.3